MRPPIEKQAYIKGKRIKIYFEFNFGVLTQIKSLPGRIYHPKEGDKHWSCPISADTATKLQGWGFKLDTKLQQLIASNQKRIEHSLAPLEPTEVPGLRGELYPFQKQGVTFIEQRRGRALIADEMGLGKTIQALAWLQLRPELRPAIIIAPATMKLKWAQLTKEWIPKADPQVLYGMLPKESPTKNIIILNYDIASGWTEVLLKINPRVLIVDEGHLIKNNRTKRTRAVKRLAKRAQHVLVLTGTPATSRPIELHNAIRIVDPHLFPNRMDFAMRYCGAFHNRYGWDFTGATNTEELHHILTTTIMIRHTKREVFDQLPPKTRNVIPLEIDNAEEYNQAEKNFIKWLKQNKGDVAAARAQRAQTITKIGELKRLAARGKLKQITDWIDNFLHSEEKLVVFAVHKFVISYLMNTFCTGTVKIDGSVPMKQRQQVIEQFQTNPHIQLFIGNIKAAGVGIDLTAATNVAFIELGWTPAEHNQAEDRVHARLDNPHGATIHYLIGVGTIEEKIAKLLDAKRRILNQLLDGEETKNTDLLTELLKEYEQQGEVGENEKERGKFFT